MDKSKALFYLLVFFSHFPQLNECGGFETMRCEPTKQLKLVHVGAFSVEELRTFGTGRLYLRPIQKDIPLKEIEITSEEQLCLTCGTSVVIAEMRQHLTTCVNLEVTFVNFWLLYRLF